MILYNSRSRQIKHDVSESWNNTFTMKNSKRTIRNFFLVLSEKLSQFSILVFYSYTLTLKRFARYGMYRLMQKMCYCKKGCDEISLSQFGGSLSWKRKSLTVHYITRLFIGCKPHYWTSLVCILVIKYPHKSLLCSVSDAPSQVVESVNSPTAVENEPVQDGIVVQTNLKRNHTYSFSLFWVTFVLDNKFDGYNKFDNKLLRSSVLADLLKPATTSKAAHHDYINVSELFVLHCQQ